MKSIAIEPAIMKSIPVKLTPMELTPVELTPVKSAKSTAVERPHLVKSTAVKAAKSAAVKTPAASAAMRPGIGEIWLTERGSA